MQADLALFRPPTFSPRHWSARALNRIGSALDTGVLRIVQSGVDAMLLPSPERLPALRASAKPLLSARLQREPERLFDFGGEPSPVEVRSRFLRSLDGGGVIERELTTDYRPALTNGNGHAADASPVVMQHWIHGPGDPIGTVVALHGFSMGRPRIDAIALLASHWFSLGLDVALVTLPHHGSRTPKHARFSGEPFATADVSVVAEAVRQAIYEVRLCTTWLREQSRAPVGLTGMSLGAYLSSLMAGLYDDLDFVVPMLPPVCMGDLAWRFFTRSRHYQEGLPTAFSREELRAAFRAHSPLAHAPRIARKRMLIVAGRGDRIVPPEHPAALWRHWGKPRLHWYDGGHLSPFGRRRIAHRIRIHMERLSIL